MLVIEGDSILLGLKKRGFGEGWWNLAVKSIIMRLLKKLPRGIVASGKCLLINTIVPVMVKHIFLTIMFHLTLVYNVLSF